MQRLLDALLAAELGQEAGKQKLRAGGEEIKVGGDAGPCVADWDGDGRLDLLVGDGDGAVWLFRNDGEKERPEFAAGTRLIEASPYRRKTLSSLDGITAHGTRTKVCATDYDGDGRLDLLVGDYLSVLWPQAPLDASQVRERDELREKERELERRLAELDERGSGEDEARAAVLEEREAVRSALRRLEGGREGHGFVWFFRRAAPATAGEAASRK